MCKTLCSAVFSALAACSAAAQPSTAVITVGVQETLDPTFFVETLGPTMAHLRKSFPEKRFHAEVLSVSDLTEAVRTRRISLLMADSGLFSYEEKTSGVRDIAVRRQPLAEDPARASSSAVIVRADRKDIRDIRDLKGSSVAALSPTSFDGWLITASLLADMGFDPEKFWRKTVFTNYQDPGVAELVLTGETDAGILPACGFESLLNQRGFPAGGLKVLNPQPAEGLRCLRSAPLYPDIVFAAVPGLPADFHKALTVAVLTQPPSFGGFSWSKADNFAHVDDLYRTLRLGPYSYLRELNWQVIREKYLPFVFGALAVLLFGFIHIVRTNRLVKIRTRQLREAMARQALLEKESRESLLRLSQMERSGVVSQMSGMLAHEIMQPATSLTNFEAGLRKYTEKVYGHDETVTYLCGVIKEEVHRIAEIVGRVRSYAKGTDSPRESVRVSSLINAAVRTFRHSTTSENVRVILTGNDDPTITANRLELELVLFNLMKNGAAAMADENDKVLTVSTETTDSDTVIVSVADNGPAISDESFARLAEPITSLKKDGLGLGLSLAKTIVERHGGHLEFERRRRGLAARVILPIVKENEAH